MAGDQPNWNMSMGGGSHPICADGGTVDTERLKRFGREVVRVRIPLCAPYSKGNLKKSENIVIINCKVKEEIKSRQPFLILEPLLPYLFMDK